MLREAALELVHDWVERGWLRSLDHAFARFIAREDQTASGITLLAAALTSHQLGRSHICLDLDAPLVLVRDDDEQAHDFAIDAASWRAALATDTVSVGTGPGVTPLVLDGPRVYLRRYWEYEQVVAKAIRARIASGKLTVVTGGPGTGKTTSVMARLAALQQGSDRTLRVALAAPTGKAAARLGENASTLHRLLGRRPGSRHFRHHADNPLIHDIVVVDEASMVDLEMTAQLMQALKPDAHLIMLGDKDQLSSVEAGAVMADLCDLGGAHVTTLTHSHRFGARPGIGALAAAVNAGDAAAVEAVWQAGHDHLHRQILGAPGDFDRVVIDDGYRVFAKVVNAGADPADTLEAFGRFQLLCALRAGDWGVAGLNARIEGALAAAGALDCSDRWYHGRPVMVTRNDYSLGLMNGDIGVTLKDGDQPWVWFRTGDKLKRVLPSRLTEVDTVFAMTVHKSQGSEFAHAALVLPNRVNPVLTRELLYTGITRASDRFTLLLPETEVLGYALAHRTQRASGLLQATALQPSVPRSP